MTLNNFRTKELVWDKATKQIYESFEANSGDSNGRKLVVQVLDGGVIVDLSGTQLHLSWKSNNNDNKGLDAFQAVNLSEGTFEIAYTTEMLSNVGKLSASLVLIDDVGRVESNLFTITVSRSNVDDDSVQSENSFTALTEALVTVNKYDSRIANVESGKADKSFVETEIERLDLKDENLTAQLAQTVRTADNRQVKTLFGVIRNDGVNGWQFVEDASHAQLNLANLEVVNDNLRLKYDFLSEKVGSLVVVADETMASKGIVAGASVGTSYADLSFYTDLQLTVAGDGSIPYIKSELENIISVEKREDGTGLTVNHPKITDGLTDFPSVTQMQDLDSQIEGLEPVRNDTYRVAWEDSKVHIVNYKDFSGIVFYDGTNWVVETDNVNKPVLTYAQHLGRLTIEHPEDITPSDNLGGVMVNDYSRTDSDVRATLTSIGPSAFFVEFRDSSGTVIKEPNTNMRFSYFRNIKVESLMPDSARFVVKRGKVKMPASDLITGGSGNFWIQGLMNV